MSRALFETLTPQQRVEVIVKHRIPIVDLTASDLQQETRRRVASAVQASGKHHSHRQH